MKAKKITAAAAAFCLMFDLTACSDNKDSKTGEKTVEALYTSTQQVTDSPDWVTSLPEAKDETVDQLFCIAAMGLDETTATVSMNERDENGEWKQILTSPAFVGMNGMCEDKDRVAGNKKTPMGTYHFTKAFGIADDPGCAMPYTKVNEDIYWSGDDREGMHYNEMVNINDVPGLIPEECEHIIDYDVEYQYCLDLGFNTECTPGRGAAIFLHCMHISMPYTYGCVAVPENIMRLILQKVDPDCTVVIGLYEEMGGEKS